MTAYWINTFKQIDDPDKLSRYAALAGPAMQAAGGRFLARGNPSHALEEATHLRTTLIEFPSSEAARAAYDSDAYQQALRVLGDGARREIRIIDALPSEQTSTEPAAAVSQSEKTESTTLQEVIAPSILPGSNVRTPMSSFQRPPLRATWVFAGDSITHGMYHTYGARSWVEHVHERIRWQLDRLDDVVINSGVSGWTAQDLLHDHDRLVIRYEPQVASYSFGANEALDGADGVSAFRAALQTLVARAQDAGAQVMLHTPVPATRDSPVRSANLPAYASAVRTVADHSGAVLVDHDMHWRNHFDGLEPIAWLDDHTHPNAAGHVEMANLTLTTLGLGPVELGP